MIGQGIKEIERVDEPWSHLDEADLIVFPDVYEGALQEYLVSQGKRVWGCRMGCELELDRAKAKEIAIKAGIDIGPYEVIKGLDALREHLKEHDDQHIKVSATRGDFETFHSPTYKKIEPRLDDLEHTLGARKKIIEFIVEEGISPAIEAGYDGYTVDGKYPDGAIIGIEIKDRAYVGCTMRYGKMPEPVRRVNDGLAPALKKYGYRGFISTEVRCTPDGGAYLVDMTCFADDTEILTNQGWKLFQDLDRSEAVATLNVETGEIEYQTPEDYISQPFKGDMVLISNKEKGIECLVTPNHGVWRTDRRGSKLFRERADSLTDKGYIPRIGSWAGSHCERYTIPSYQSEWVCGRSNSLVRECVREEIEVAMNDWLRFLAVWLGDGSLGSGHVSVTQHEVSKNKEKVASIVNALPFNVQRNARGFEIASMQLREHLLEFGKCNQKRVPSYVKELSKEQIEIFLDAYVLCDGSDRGRGKIYYTTSEGLADDLQELIFKAGRLSNITKIDAAGTLMTVGGKTYKRNHDSYRVTECPKQNRFWFETGSRAERYFSKVPYDGVVHDVTVPNGTVYVRRNGKPFWSSNCRGASPPSELYQNMISNLGEVMWYGAEGLVVEPDYIAKWGAQVILSSDWADDNWQQISFPKSIRDNVKLRNFCVIDGEYYVIPQSHGAVEIGAVVATGDTAAEAIAECKRIAKLVEGYSVEAPVDAMDEALAGLKKLLADTKEEPKPPLQRKAEEMFRAGKISAKQLDKMVAAK